MVLRKKSQCSKWDAWQLLSLSSALSIILLIIALMALIITWGGKYFYHAFLYGALHVLVPLLWGRFILIYWPRIEVYLNHDFSFFSLQNYLNESLKHLDKSYPNTSLAGLHNPMTDTKPIYIDSKILLGHQHVDNNKNNTSK